MKLNHLLNLINQKKNNGHKIMKIVIIGAGTAAISVADIIIQDRNFKIAGFVGTKKEETKLEGKELYGSSLFLGSRSILKQLKNDGVVGFIAGIGDNYIREEAYYEGTGLGLIPINAISHHAIIEPSARIGKGVIISAGCIISHGVSIGNNTFIGSNVIIEINSEIGENCHLFPGSIIGGQSEIGRNVTCNPRSTVKHSTRIGKNQIIKSGAVINKDLKDLIRNQK